VAQREASASCRGRGDVGDLPHVHAVDRTDEIAGLEPCLVRERARRHLLDRQPTRRGRARLDTDEREHARTFFGSRLNDARRDRRGRDVEREAVHHADQRRRARRARCERDLDVAGHRGVERMIAMAAEPLFQQLADHDIDVVRAGDDAFALDGGAVHRRMAGAEERPAERDAGGASLREAGADQLHTIADLDRARRDLGDLDERRNSVSLAASETECRNGRGDEEQEGERSRAQHARSF
jgi:hypothetical protein